MRGGAVCYIKIDEVTAAVHLKPQLAVIDIPSDVYRLIRLIIDVPILDDGAKHNVSFYVRIPVVCHVHIEGQRAVPHRHNVIVFVIVEKLIKIDLDRIIVKHSYLGVLISRACKRHFAAGQPAAVGHSVKDQHLVFKRRTVLVEIGGVAAALASALTAALRRKGHGRFTVCGKEEGVARAHFLELDLGGIAV